MADVTMVERVARALCDAQGRSWGAADAESHDRWRDLARAAIAAMRGPLPDAMIEASAGLRIAGCYDGMRETDAILASVIDAALAEGEGG